MKSLPIVCILLCTTLLQSLAFAEQGHKPSTCWQPDEPAQGFLREIVESPAVESGFLPIHGSMEALEWRLALIDAAQHNIDMQYLSGASMTPADF